MKITSKIKEKIHEDYVIYVWSVNLMLKGHKKHGWRAKKSDFCNKFARIYGVSPKTIYRIIQDATVILKSNK